MSLISKADRAHIENKYHLTDKPFNAHERFSYHGYDYDETTGLNDEEMAIRLKEVADEQEAKGTLPAVNKARGFECVLDNTRIDVNGYDYFVGFYSWGRPIDNQFIWRPYENIVSKKYNIDYNRHSRIMNDSGTAAMWIDFDHVVPDWDAVLSLGFKGLRDRAREYRKMNESKAPLTDRQKDFYDSIEIEYNAILRIITVKGVLSLTALVIISSFAYTLSLMPLKYHPVSKVTIYNLLITVFGVIMSGIVLRENIFKIEYIVVNLNSSFIILINRLLFLRLISQINSCHFSSVVT